MLSIDNLLVNLNTNWKEILVSVLEIEEIERNGIAEAHGLCFSVQESLPIPPIFEKYF